MKKINFFLIFLYACVWVFPLLLTLDNNYEYFWIYVAAGHIIFWFSKGLFSRRKKDIKYLMSTGFYTEEKLKLMDDGELTHRYAHQKLYEGKDSSALSYSEIKSGNRKELAGAASDVLSNVGAAASKAVKVASILATSAEDTSSSKAMVCRNCGHRMGFFQKDGLHAGMFANPCEKEGKRCVAAN